ncbi:MAG TPA: nickel pincer cofactor biosynthesis protein LarC [Chloroflexota bacterium]|nr:nickel pincer cofactor biosynthesis protein LarC [Chloroflexota bacterium]
MIAYFDCYSGISGDMTLGALVDAGVDPEALKAEVAKLGLDGYELRFERMERHGITGTHAAVDLDPSIPQPHRHLSDILAILDGSALAPSVKQRASDVFRTLGEAEASVHGVPVDHVHFHEVGAVDALVDVVGSVAGLELLGVKEVFCSVLPSGKGTIEAAHGILPVPAPATLEIMARAGIPTKSVDVEAELVTPTGAAIVATLATFKQPDVRVRSVGYGFGTKQLPWANALRLWVGEPLEEGASTEETSLIEANLDDMPAEALGYAMERLFAAGALDVYFTPIQMKKNRPATMLSVISSLDKEQEIASMVLRETTTLGVRVSRTSRVTAERRVETVDTTWGPVRVKVKSFGGITSYSPEFEDCARVARERDLPLQAVVQGVLDVCPR